MGYRDGVATGTQPTVGVPRETVLDDERFTLVGLFLEAAAGFTADLERRLAPLGLTRSTAEILVRLARSPGARLRMCDLAAQVTLSASGLTRAVDRLVRDGLVAREACPSDGRGLHAVLTSAGQRRVEEMAPVLRAQHDEMLWNLLDDDQRAAFAQVLRAVRDAVHPGATAGVPGAAASEG